MSETKQVVKVSIGGDEYSLRSDRSPEYTEAVAQHVDHALREALAAAPRVETHKAAVLAALAVADELFQARLEARELERRIQELADRLARFLPPKKRPSRTSGAFAQTGDDG